MGGSSKSSNTTSSTSKTIDAKQTADGQAIVARASDGGQIVVNKTLDDAVQIAADAFNSVDGAVSANGDTFREAIDFASRTLQTHEDITRVSLDAVAGASSRSLDALSYGFNEALQESREDTTQLLSQLITFGIPAAVIYLVWRNS